MAGERGPQGLSTGPQGKPVVKEKDDGDHVNGIDSVGDSVVATEGTSRDNGISEGKAGADQVSYPSERSEPYNQCNVATKPNEEEDDDVLIVAVHPGKEKAFPSRVMETQRTITSFQGFRPKPEMKSKTSKHKDLTTQLQQTKATIAASNLQSLPDKGERLLRKEKELLELINCLSISPLKGEEKGSVWGKDDEDRLCAVRNATSEAIEQLHKCLETCPSPETTAEDPGGLKVPLLLHQKQAMAWLLWRETQRPPGGILADDMGLGKTLTMVALILAQKRQKQKEKRLEEWISKTDSTLVISHGTLIICPASLVHHWKKEVEKRVAPRKLSVYLYHGSNRERDCRMLSEYDIVVTTYSLVSKEIPVKKEEGDVPAKDQDLEVCGGVFTIVPLLRMAGPRIILDEAHNNQEPKSADVYSSVFLRCSPFDGVQNVEEPGDNGSRKGAERLNILKDSAARRDQGSDGHLGQPLVLLPQRRCELHRLSLSEKEQSVYDVIFARSRSTLQNYLKRHEGKAQVPACTGNNSFERVASEFGSSQPMVQPSVPAQVSSTVHILSLLLRLRQCCCHLSLLKVALDQTELKSEGLTLSLEEQLNALSLCETKTHDPKSTVSLNGTNFPADLFDTETESTKISSLLSQLQAIGRSSEINKSVIVSQWTSMLKIVSAHLKRIGLSFATIDGSVNPKQRMDVVEDFNNNPKGPQVMLVSLCAGGVGLNLIGGNHLFLLDIHWNPALEDQACDRIYRVGQRKDVVIHRFECVGTVEEKISQLQAKKKELANSVLAGNGARPLHRRCLTCAFCLDCNGGCFILLY
ncbi:hypothetical protein GDO86_018485 [Hymenochirus boettgeri]|uniref:Transcription termination factor 2 n=1 Tax=Hymenochirus boettgeri TaxID=247094 RepID=A0A8T2IGB6_9PIPI|nr:hypothetical protein GDO86_018485 [Hymenochirus boettgeri]